MKILDRISLQWDGISDAYRRVYDAISWKAKKSGGLTKLYRQEQIDQALVYAIAKTLKVDLAELADPEAGYDNELILIVEEYYRLLEERGEE